MATLVISHPAPLHVIKKVTKENNIGEETFHILCHHYKNVMLRLQIKSGTLTNIYFVTSILLSTLCSVGYTLKVC